MSNVSVLILSSLMAVATSPKPDAPPSYELPVVAGLWELPLENAGMCKELYKFGRDGEFATVSGAEQTVGKYVFLKSDHAVLPVLSMETDKDNNEPDCMGQQVDQSQEAFAVFIQLDSTQNPRKMQWCLDDQGEHCIASLYKILP